MVTYGLEKSGGLVGGRSRGGRRPVEYIGCPGDSLNGITDAIRVKNM
jgi:hypothetical protein